VVDEDWHLAGTVWEVSRAVRDEVALRARDRDMLHEQAINARLARREIAIEDTKEQRALKSAARTVYRRAARAPTVATRPELTLAISGRDRRLISADDAIRHAIAEGWLVEGPDGFAVGAAAP